MTLYHNGNLIAIKHLSVMYISDIGLLKIKVDSDEAGGLLRRALERYYCLIFK